MMIKSRIKDNIFKIDDKIHEYLKHLFCLLGFSKDCLTTPTKSYASIQIGTMIQYHLENETLVESKHCGEYVVFIKPKELALPDSFSPIRHDIAKWLSKFSKWLIDSGGFFQVEERKIRKSFY